jgi:allantoinase
MKQAARLGLIVAVHAEDDVLACRLTQERIVRGGVTVRDYLGSRPIEAGLKAIALALEISGETGCGLHIVHVSSAEGVRLARSAREAGAE